MNFLVVMADDHGGWASAPYGHHEFHTPTMDWLAARGQLFAEAFSPCPVCSPARASFFTARLPSQHGILDYLKESDSPDRDWLAGRRTLPSALKDAGYRTGLVGKWHCGRSWQPQPGFDRWVSFAGTQFLHQGSQDYVVDGTVRRYGGHQSSFFRDEALRFLRESAAEPDRPFFLFVGPVDTHSPFRDQPRRLVERYAAESFDRVPDEPLSIPEEQARIRAPKDPVKRREMLAQYAAAVTGIDELLGQLIDECEALGVLDNTMVVYTSDHGHMNGHHGLYTKGNATIPQNFYEESIRIPLLTLFPGGRHGGRADFPVDLADLSATIADLAGADLQRGDGTTVAGRSFAPWLRGGEYPGKGAQLVEYGNARMILQDGWKFIRRYPPHDESHGDELYHLATDPRERINLAPIPAHRARRDALGAELDRRFAAAGCPPREDHPVLDLPPHNPFEPWRRGTDWVRELIETGARNYDGTRSGH